MKTRGKGRNRYERKKNIVCNIFWINLIFHWHINDKPKKIIVFTRKTRLISCIPVIDWAESSLAQSYKYMIKTENWDCNSSVKLKEMLASNHFICSWSKRFLSLGKTKTKMIAEILCLIDPHIGQWILCTLLREEEETLTNTAVVL